MNQCVATAQWTMTLRLTGALPRDGVALQVLEDGREVIRVREEAGRLVLSVRTYAKDTPLELSMPLPTPPVTLELIWLGHRVELWADGVLADEEWPMGNAFRGGNLWLRQKAPGVGEVTLADGAEERIRPPRSIESAQYWAPALGHWNVGDCMPFYDDGVYHLFYLWDRNGHKSKWGKGAHQFAHMSTRDFVHWEEHPIAVEVTEDWEGSICTGSVLRAGDTYYAFYSARMMDETSARLSWATSKDCIHFTKSGRSITLAHPYETTSARDPEVFRDEEGLYHMLVTTELVDAPRGRNGCLAHLTSRDLEQWEQQEPFLVPGYSDQPECPNYFAWNGWYYLIYSNYGTAKYRYSRHPLGPWERPEREILDGLLYRVPKTAAFQEGRRISAGFLCIEPDGNSYGGNVVFRELRQREDGTLAMGFVPELLPPAAGRQERLSLKAATPPAYYVEEAVRSLPTGFSLRLTTSAGPKVSHGLTLRFDNGTAYEIRLEAYRQMVSVATLYENPFREQKQCLHDVSLDSGHTELALVFHKGILDLCVNGAYTLVCRLPGTEDAQSCTLACYAKDGGADFQLTY